MHAYSRRSFLQLGLAAAAAGMLGLTGCRNALPRKKLIVACGSDIGGLAIEAALTRGMAASVDFGSDETFIGDCCGSTAQFTLSTGDVDVAVLCPDAVQSLRDADEDFVELGTIVYDGNVLVAPGGNALECTNVGYMAERYEQLDDLEAFYEGREVEFRSLYTFSTAYALANGLVQAAAMDVAAGAKTGYVAEPFTSNQPTSVLVARGSLAGDERLAELLETCNTFLAELQDEGEGLVQLLCELFESDDVEEVMSWWRNSTTQFGFHLEMTE